MRVLVDCGLIGKPRGLGRYLKELLNALFETATPGIEIFALVPYGCEEIARECGARNIHGAPALAIPLWEQLIVPRFAMKLRADIVHHPCNTKGFALDFLRIPHVVTLHDLMFFEVRPSSLYQRLGNAYRRFVTRRMFSDRLGLITVSSASRNKIHTMFDRDACVIYEPVALFSKCAEHGSQDCDKIAAVGGPYFVHIGGEADHKNSRLVIDAFRAAELPEHKLVILGVPDDGSIARASRGAKVLVPGWVSDRGVASYISGACGMLFPSLMEGYGLPIVEAFALGCPVVTSNFAPMSEVAGDAAILVNPRSSREIADACRSLAGSDTLRARLVGAGRLRLKKFSTENMRSKTLEVYRSVMADSRL